MTLPPGGGYPADPNEPPPGNPYAPPPYSGPPAPSGPQFPANPYAQPSSYPPPAEPQPQFPANPYAPAPAYGAPPPYPAAAPSPLPGEPQPSYPGGAYPYSPYPGADAKGTDGFAITSLVLGILGICGISSIVSIIFGILALRRIGRGERTGKGLAIAGIICSALWIVLLVVLIIVGIANQSPFERDSSGAITHSGKVSDLGSARQGLR